MSSRAIRAREVAHQNAGKLKIAKKNQHLIGLSVMVGVEFSAITSTTVGAVVQDVMMRKIGRAVLARVVALRSAVITGIAVLVSQPHRFRAVMDVALRVIF